VTPEGKVKAKVKKYLTEMGCYYAMPATGGYGLSGTPDFLICYRGMFVAIECKANGNKPTALQEAALQRIRDAKGMALVIDETNVDDLKELFGYE
jgi:Holliday junction resolvase